MVKSMKVRDVMTNRVISIGSSSTVKDAAVLMNSNNIGAVPVVDGGSVKGMLTDRDIVLRCVAENKDAATIKVSDICSKGAISVKPDQSVTEAMDLMSGDQVRRLPVVENDKIVGMLSFADVAREKAGMELAETISDISMP